MEMDTHTLPNAHTYLTCEGNQRSINESAGYFFCATVYAIVYASVYAMVKCHDICHGICVGICVGIQI